MDNPKIPPHSAEAEQALIGAVMLDPSIWDSVAYLRPEDFYRHDHRDIWSRLADPNMRDFVSLSDALGKESLSMLTAIMQSCTGTAFAEKYAAAVRDRAIIRRFVAACHQSAADAMSQDVVSTAMISDHIKFVDGLLAGSVSTQGLRHVVEITRDWFDSTLARGEGGRVAGVETGFPFLDRRWGGLRDATVTIIAGRPKTGKTTLALNIAEHISRKMPVAIYQMEMGGDEMADRLIASVGRVPLDDIRSGAIRKDHVSIEGITDAVNKLKVSELYIDATPRQTIDHIRASAKKFARDHGKTVIFIDYLGLIETNVRATKNESVSELSREVKLLAKELNCPIVLLCQMNRNAERERRKPNLSDLRDSGSIEQDADVICFTHKDSEDQNYSEIITRAIRSGKAGTDYLLCMFDVGRFETPCDGWEPQKKKNDTNKKESGTGW